MLFKSQHLRLFPAICIMMIGCQSKTDHPFYPANIKTNLSDENNRVVGELLNHYLELKNALVVADSKNSNKNALLMQTNLVLLEQDLKKDSVGNKELIIQSDSLSFQIKNILAHNTSDCEPQRIYFKYVSDNIFNIIKLTGANHLNLFHQYCPMALNEKGGWWLSTSQDIENPYFGSKMLTCGEVVDTLK